MKYRYYILHDDGDVFGTNSLDEVMQCLKGTDSTAIDAETGEFLDEDDDRYPVDAWMPPVELVDEEVDEEVDE